ncbi:MAG: hypothetical protein UU36_C0021G0005 [Candidatus Uhrbacteria bacterium GW2011_GWE2_41_1153]|nr:MAG: hypothetical protein UU36_C0021G0005 [Candidatus Uhrbacteria bacterium GW2011_GWE2_41_1153]
MPDRRRHRSGLRTGVVARPRAGHKPARHEQVGLPGRHGLGTCPRHVHRRPRRRPGHNIPSRQRSPLIVGQKSPATLPPGASQGPPMLITIFFTFGPIGHKLKNNSDGNWWTFKP